MQSRENKISRLQKEVEELNRQLDMQMKQYDDIIRSREQEKAVEMAQTMAEKEREMCAVEGGMKQKMGLQETCHREREEGLQEEIRGILKEREEKYVSMGLHKQALEQMQA